jgi:hypothetical protein
MSGLTWWVWLLAVGSMRFGVGNWLLASSSWFAALWLLVLCALAVGSLRFG